MTIEWTGPNQGKLRKALLNVYPTIQELRLFVRDNFNYPLKNLPDAEGCNKETWAEKLIEEAITKDWIDELYKNFCTVNQNNKWVIQLIKELNEGRLIESPHLSNSIVRRKVEEELVEDLSSTHLVIAVFWQEPSKQKIRINAKFCYRDSKTHEILQKTLNLE